MQMLMMITSMIINFPDGCRTSPYCKHIAAIFDKDLKAYYPKNIWAPASTDKDLFNYFLWHIYERKFTKISQSKNASMKDVATAVTPGFD